LARKKFKSENIVDFTPELDVWERISKKFGLVLNDAFKQVLSAYYGALN
jgi:hypothetical protein